MKVRGVRSQPRPSLYKFMYSYVTEIHGKVLVFERPMPGDSRVDQILIKESFFWKGIK